MSPILTLTTAPAAAALSWSAEAKGHLRVDTDDEQTRVQDVLFPAVTDWCEGVTGRQFITATWTAWWPSFTAACGYARRHGFPADTILMPRPPLVSVTWVKYYDTNNAIQTWASSNYTVTASPAGAKGGPGWVRPVAGTVYPSSYTRPDAVEIKFVAGYGSAYTDVPGGLRHAMLLMLGELFERREIAIAGTIIQQVPMGALQIAQGYQVEL